MLKKIHSCYAYLKLHGQKLEKKTYCEIKKIWTFFSPLVGKYYQKYRSKHRVSAYMGGEPPIEETWPLMWVRGICVSTVSCMSL